MDTQLKNIFAQNSHYFGFKLKVNSCDVSMIHALSLHALAQDILIVALTFRNESILLEEQTTPILQTKDVDEISVL